MDIAASILSRLPLDSILALANSLKNPPVLEEDHWRDLIQQLGYPPVPFAQGFYFSLQGLTPAEVLRNILLSKVDAHLKVYLDRHGVELLLDKGVTRDIPAERLTPHAMGLLKSQVFKSWECPTPFLEVEDYDTSEVREYVEGLILVYYKCPVILEIIVASVYEVHLNKIEGVITDLDLEYDKWGEMIPILFKPGRYLYPPEDAWNGFFYTIVTACPQVFDDPDYGWLDFRVGLAKTRIERIFMELQELADRDYARYRMPYFYVAALAGKSVADYIYRHAAEIRDDGDRAMVLRQLIYQPDKEIEEANREALASIAPNYEEWRSAQ